MSDNIKNIVVVSIIGMLLFLFPILTAFTPDTVISKNERRLLQQKPSLELDTLLSGSFMEDFNRYTVDQFPFRDTFLRLYTQYSLQVLQKQDINGLYIKDDGAIAMEYPFHEDSIEYAVSLFQKIYKENLNDSNQVYFSIIPDKSYFLKDQPTQLTLDYDRLFEKMKTSLPMMSYIDITSFLSLDDYYKTDPHWRQENIVDVANHLAQSMGTSIPTPFHTNEIDKAFRGSYFEKASQYLSPERMFYLTNDTLDHAVVYDYQNNQKIPMYNFDKLNGFDFYEFYVSGPLSYVTIENPKAMNQKELVIFRDSFTSSLAPLLLEGYRSITLLDIRYLPSHRLQSLIDFQQKDILFLYSTSVLNHSQTLK